MGGPVAGAVTMPAGERNDAEIVVDAWDVGRTFGGRPVLSGLDLSIRAGEFVALVGRSGSGKSTLLRVLAGLDDEFTGTVAVASGRTLVFQDARLLPWLRVLDNVTLGMPPGGVPIARAVLSEVGLGGRERSWPKTLSGGESQRVALARALARQPRLLLLDEPFGALDAITRLQMRRLLRDLHSAHRPGTLLVTHDIDEALDLAERVVVLSGGQLTLSLETGQDAADSRAEMRMQLLDALGVAAP